MSTLSILIVAKLQVESYESPGQAWLGSICSYMFKNVCCCDNQPQELLNH